jgi:hypothetical protein
MKIQTILGGQLVTIAAKESLNGYYLYTITSVATGGTYTFEGSAPSNNHDNLRLIGWAVASDAELGMASTLEVYADSTGRSLDTTENQQEAQESWESCQDSLAAFKRLGMDPVKGECANQFTILA